jgi:8-oxo-dGTP pyrophosphatase MutT (NUDIX family)
MPQKERDLISHRKRPIGPRRRWSTALSGGSGDRPSNSACLTRVGSSPEPVYRLRMIDRESLRLRLEIAAALPVCDCDDARGDARPADRLPHDHLTPAAVLLGLVGYADGPRVILTQRTGTLRDHAGQISFPGGRIEPGDSDPEAAALRETHEETGLATERVEILGRLSPCDTITGFRVHPVVGWIEPPVSYIPDPVEVAEVFEVPLAFVLDSANHRRDSTEAGGLSRSFYVLDYHDRHIWGATAGILVDFARLLTA